MTLISASVSATIGNAATQPRDLDVTRDSQGGADITALASSIREHAATDPAGAYQRFADVGASLRPTEQGELARSIGEGIFEPGSDPQGPDNPNFPLPRGPFPLPEFPKDGPGFPRLPGNDNPNFPLPRGPFPLPEFPKDGPGFPRIPGGSDNPNFPLPRGPFPIPDCWPRPHAGPIDRPDNTPGIPDCWPHPGSDNPNFPLPRGPFPLPDF